MADLNEKLKKETDLKIKWEKEVEELREEVENLKGEVGKNENRKI